MPMAVELERSPTDATEDAADLVDWLLQRFYAPEGAVSPRGWERPLEPLARWF